MSKEWAIYKNGSEMKFYIGFHETFRGKKEKITLPEISDILKVKKFKIWKIRAFSKLKQIPPEEYEPIRADKSTSVGVSKIDIITSDKREFSIEVQIRIDDSEHNKPTHVNIDLKYEDKKSRRFENRKLIKYIENIHETKIEPNLPKFFFIDLDSSKGRNHTRFRFGIFPEEGKEYHIKQTNFIKNLKDGVLTEHDKILFKKESSDCSQSLKKRLIQEIN